MVFMKKLLISVITIAVCLWGGVALNGATVLAAKGGGDSTGATKDCDPNDTNFLAFPTWYRGLKCDANNDGISIAQGQDLSAIIFTIALNVIDIILRLIGIIAVGFIIWGGFQYIISRGEPERSKAAIITVRNAVVGMVIAMLAAITTVHNAVAHEEATSFSALPPSHIQVAVFRSSSSRGCGRFLRAA